MRIFGKGLVVLVVFAITFLVTTIVSDIFDKRTGYYTKGIQDSNEVGK